MTLFAVLPKQGSVFVFGVPVAGTNSGRDGMTVMDAPHVEFELYGNQFCFRAVDRAGRKFKHKESIELWDRLLGMQRWQDRDAMRDAYDAVLWCTHDGRTVHTCQKIAYLMI
jgi:hypothetical protein